MKRLIRRLVNWAYGIDLTDILVQLQIAKSAYGIYIYNEYLRRRMEVDQLNDELSNIKHILNNHEAKLKKK